MNDNIGLFDMDDSLADYEGQLQLDMDALRDPAEPPFDIADLHKPVVPRHLLQRETVVRRQPGWWESLPALSSGMWAYKCARNIGFENRILTKGPASNSAAWDEKLRWCHRHLGPDASVTITRNKDNAYGKFLYDDFPAYATDWLAHRPRGVVIMPINRHNVDFQHPRVFKWDRSDNYRLERVLRAIFSRKPSEPLVIPA